jgi:hexosaminidase
MKYTAILLLLSGVVGSYGKCEMSDSVVPALEQFENKSGFCRLGSTVDIVLPENSDGILPMAKAFSADARKVSAVKFSPLSKYNSSKSGVVLHLDTRCDDTESYRLNVSTRRVDIYASGEAGLYYGLQTLLQLIPPGAKDAVIPCCRIEDGPRFKWRGVMLDCSRHFFSVPEIKRVLDMMAMFKLNTFHWHLVDDPAWRLEIKKYPQLTEKGSLRNGRRTNKDGFFYSQKQVRDVIRYAADRAITVVPEIEMPGHSWTALSIMRNLRCNPGNNQNIYCAGKDETFEFLEDVLDEVFALFPSEYVHIGGDEAGKAPWKNCPLCQKRMQDNDLKNENELQSWFVKRIEKFFSTRGRRMLGWDEIIEGGLSPAASVMHWRDGAGASVEHAAAEGHNVVMTPQSFCYLDFHQDRDWFNEPPGWNGAVTLQKAYSFEPVPASLPQDKEHFILGGQGNLWTERVATDQHLEYMLFPRIIALSESLWSPKSKRSYASFAKRLPRALERLSLCGINYRDPDGIDFKLKGNKLTMLPEIPGAKILYTLDGSEPTLASEVYHNSITITRPVVVRAVSLGIDGKPGRTKEFVAAGYVSARRIKLKCSQASHSKHTQPQRMLDGSSWTVWRTTKLNPGASFPVDIDLKLPAKINVRGFIYEPHTDGADQGYILKYQIFSAADNEKFTEPFFSGTFVAARQRRVVIFPQPKSATRIRLRILDAVGDYVSISELKIIR